MEEIEYKLKSKNTILITEAIDKLLDLIVNEKSTELEDTNKPLTFLKEKCISEDSVISLTASRGFLNLIARGYLDIAPAMSVAVSMLPSAKNNSAITSIISGIFALIVDLQMEKNENKTFECCWSLVSPLHPFIMVLNQHPSAIQDILSQVESLCLYHESISKHSIEIMRPVFLWVLCNPDECLSPQIYHKAIHALQGLEDHPKHIDILLECLLWQQQNYPLKRVNYLMTYLLDMAIRLKNDELVQALVVLMADMSVTTISCGEDPRMYFKQIKSAVNYPNIEMCCDVLLSILSEAIPICPAVYSLELILICNDLIKHCELSLSSFILTSSLLQWLYYPTTLTVEFNNIAKNIVENVFKSSEKAQCKNVSENTLKLCKNKMLCLFRDTHLRIFKYTQLIGNFDKISSNSDQFNVWIDKMRNCNNIETKCQLVPFLNGIVLMKANNFVNKIEILKILQNVCEERKSLSTGLLPVMLYALRQSNDPEEIVHFLKTIVHLAVIKENVPLIVQILDNTKNEKQFSKSFLISLYCILVCKQVRCYPYLQELLLDTTPGGSGDGEWEILTAKAAAVKFLCEERSANFGTEMVPMISSLLNRCSDTSSSAAYCFALQALKGLWDARVVTPISTWKALAPKIGKDKRATVQIEVCKLLKNIPEMHNNTPEYDAFLISVAVKLWSYVVDSHHPEVTVAALDALGNYNLQDMTLKQIPEIYRKGAQLPSEYCKTPSDAARKPEDVLPYIPGKCWSNLFKYTNQSAIEGVSKFCHSQMSKEVSQYRSGVYQNTDGSGSRGEPTSLDYLPQRSIVRGLMEFVKSEALNPSYNYPESSFLECLRCLSLRLAKPLPPLHWNFLPELWARGSNYRAVVLPLAAQQSPVSYTCTRFLQNYLPCLDISPEKEDEMHKFLECLPVICTTIQPEYIRDTLLRIFNYALASPNVTDDSGKLLFSTVTLAMKECLQCDSVLQDNKLFISDIVEQSYESFNVDHVLWAQYADLCCELSLEYIERLTAPSSWWETTDEILEKAIYVRSVLALSATDNSGIVWLNEVIDASIAMPREHTYILQKLYEVMVKCNKGFEDWLLQLMARTQVHMVEPSANEKSIMFLCDIVILGVIMYSNYHTYTWCDGNTLCISKAARLALFPQALHHLINNPNSNKLQESSAQICEWLHHTRSSALISPPYSHSMYLSLVALRSCASLSKPSAWMKYLSVAPNLTQQ